jgi:hypothetical protein
MRPIEIIWTRSTDPTGTTDPNTLQRSRSRLSRNHLGSKGYESQISCSDMCDRNRSKEVMDPERSVHPSHVVMDPEISVLPSSHCQQLQIPRNQEFLEQSNCTRTSTNTKEYQVSKGTRSL